MNTKQTHGYLALPRQSLLLMKDLGYSLFGFYLGLVTLTIWYRGNANFGYITKSQSEIADIFGLDQATVSRLLSKLSQKKYLVKHTRQKLIMLTYFPLFLSNVGSKMHSMDFANPQELYVEMQRLNAELQNDYANLKERQDQNGALSINNSFKGNSGSLGEDINIDDIPDNLGEV